jgi:SAM-dependent methyltransferase
MNVGSGELDSVKAALAEATGYARHLERELAAKEAALAEAGDYARSLETSLRCTAMAQAELAAKLEAIERSTTWQLSRSIRALVNRLRSLLRRSSRHPLSPTKTHASGTVTQEPSLLERPQQAASERSKNGLAREGGLTPSDERNGSELLAVVRSKVETQSEPSQTLRTYSILDAVSMDAQFACAKYLRWLIDRCAISDSELTIAGWALRYPQSELAFCVNGESFAAAEWPLASPHLTKLFNYIPGSDQSCFRCRHVLAQGSSLYRNGFIRFDLVSKQGIHGRSYRHAWFAPDPTDAPPTPEEDRIRRVIGVADPESYLRGGATIACRLDGYLRERFDQSISGFDRILDWGCGSGRVTRHLIRLAGSSTVTGVDIDADNIAWCREHLSGADFQVVGLLPPINCTAGLFDLVIGVSVFTHLAEDVQFAWLEELSRITSKGAILLVSIQGPSQMAMQSDNHLYQTALEQGFYDYGRNSDLDGVLGESDYYRAVIHSREYVYGKFGRYFDVVDIVDAIAGNQDLVVLRRR